MSILRIRNAAGQFIAIPSIKGEKGDKGDAGSVTAVNGISPDGSGNVKLGAVHPRNLLDNSDFTNPVNQRGKTSYNETGYTIDRWYTNMGVYATVTVGNGKITLHKSNSGGDIMQTLPVNLTGKTMTYAVMTADGNIWCKSAVISDSFSFTQIAGLKAYLGVGVVDGQTVFRIYFNDSSDITLELVWAALYESSYTADTLPPYVPKGYAAELAECMRYYVYIGGHRWVHGLGLYGMGIEVPVFNPVPMRVCPTVSYSSDLAFFDGSNGWISVGDANATQYTDRCSSFFIQLNTDLPETSTSKVFIVRGIESLSADL